MFARSRVTRVAPPRVLVLTMTPNGGALTATLRQLGYHPYTFEDTFRRGNSLSHPQEWRMVLDRTKPFDPAAVLAAPQPETRRRWWARKEKSMSSLVTAQEPATSPVARDFDALVGPPATLAFESILLTCPRSTRVILVEETEKIAWEKTHEQLMGSMLAHSKFSAKHHAIGHLHRLIERMGDVRATVINKRLSVNPLQLSALRLAAALDIFEMHVKATVPHDRLLVYRGGDGWGPICAFLGVPEPTGPHGELLPFPPHNDGSDIFSELSEKLNYAYWAIFVAFLVVVALYIFLAGVMRDVISDLFKLYYDRFASSAMSYAMRSDGEIREGATLRGMMKVAKRSTLDFDEELRRETNQMTTLGDYIRFVLHPNLSR